MERLSLGVVVVFAVSVVSCAQIEEEPGTGPRAVELGLEWLQVHQDPDGRWDSADFMAHDLRGEATDGPGSQVHSVGVTGLALLAFLGDGNTMRSGPYQDVVNKAVQWLREQQGDNGLYGTNASHDFIYDHTLATLAMIEAFGLSDSGLLRRYAQNGINYLESHRNPYSVWRYQPRDGDNDTSVTAWAVKAYKSAMDYGLEVNPTALANASHDYIYDHTLATLAMIEAYGLSDFNLLRRYAQNGINYLESHRNPYSVWRYQPRDGDNDTSVTSWAVLAYRSAMDFDLEVNPAALANASTWYDEVTSGNGQAGYTKRGELSSRNPGDHSRRFPPDRGEALTAAALRSRFLLGQDPEQDQIMTTAADRILSKPPLWDEDAGTIDHYYWYYATYALYRMGGDHWADWSRYLTDAVVKTQRADGNFQGSWDPIGVWGGSGGRIYSTALMLLTLQAYYRYSRLIR